MGNPGESPGFPAKSQERAFGRRPKKFFAALQKHRPSGIDAI
jgi:hypothetical protein